MADEAFDGIILPMPSDEERMGEIIGITSRELGFREKDIKVNLVSPKHEELSQLWLYWLDNCPEKGPYSRRACYSWLLPSFSVSPEKNHTAIMARPTYQEDITLMENDFIAWYGGRPVKIGHQYEMGIRMSKLLGDHSISVVVNAWQRGDYDVKFSKTMKEFENAYVENLPMERLRRPRKELEIEARNAGWEFKSALMRDFV